MQPLFFLHMFHISASVSSCCLVFAGNGGVGILLLSSKNDEDDSGLDQSCARFDDDKVAVNGVTKATGLCFLDDSMDWAGMRLSGEFYRVNVQVKKYLETFVKQVFFNFCLFLQVSEESIS